MRRRSRPPGRSFEDLMAECDCTPEERRACLEYLAFLRFRKLMRQPDGLRFLFFIFGREVFS